MRPVGETREQPVDVRILSATHKDLARAGGAGPLPRGPLLPHQRDRAARAAAARARRGHRRTSPRRSSSGSPGACGIDAPSLSRRGAGSCSGLRLPGQRARAGERARARDDAVRRRRDRAGGHRSCATSCCTGRGRRRAAAARGAHFAASRAARSRAGAPPVSAAAAPPRPPRPAAATPGALGTQLEEVERAAIVRALEQTRYNKTAAAKLLGMTFRALRYRIKKLGIE